MGCLIFLVGLVFPRVALVLLWLFTHWVGRAFDSFIVPLLGFLFVPYTLLWWIVVANVFGGAWGFWQVLFLVLALIADLSSYGGLRRWRRR